MDRRQFLVGAASLFVLAGCSRMEPPPTVASTPVGSPSQPSGLAPVASGPTAAERAVRAVLVEALRARGFGGAPVGLPGTSAFDIPAALEVGVAAFAVAFVGTMLDELSTSDQPTAPGELLEALARAVQPEASVLSTSPCDGRLVWAVGPGATLSDLRGLSSAEWRGRTAAVPSFAVNRADGIPGLQTAYGAQLTVETMDDAGARRSALTSGTAAIGAFRTCDLAELDGLGVLNDPLGLAQADPMVVLFDASLADDQPGAVLAVTDALAVLGATAFATLQRGVASGGDPEQVAREWVASNVSAR